MIEWIDIIEFCISAPRYSILVNRSLCGFFEATNGLCQGDPLPPFLFVTMAEAMERLFNKLKRNGILKGIQVTEGITLSHSQFADDTILYGEASIREAEIIRDAIDKYSKVSGQILNFRKSEVFFNINKVSQRRIANVLGISHSNLPSKHLGDPLINGGCSTAN